jgi:hypothetical protein
MPGPGRKELRSLRLKAESTPGTKVAPRFLWRGPVEGINDTREVKHVEMQVGIFGGTDDIYIPKLAAELEFASTEATFEQIPDLFLMAGFGTIGGNRAGSAQGASGSTAIFTMPIPTSNVPITYSCTAEVGDLDSGSANGFAEVIEYLLVDELKFEFTGGEAMMVNASATGRQGTATNAVGTYSNVGTLVNNVEEILSGLGSFWISPVGSGYGTGAVTAGNILAGNVTFKPVWTRKFPVDAGVLYFHTAVYTGMEITGELTLEYQISGTYGAAGSAGQVEKWRAQQPQLMRMSWPGGAITEGTTQTSRLFQIDIPFVWDSFESLGDIDGNDIRIGKFTSKYNQQTNAGGRGTVTIARWGTSEFSGA